MTLANCKRLLALYESRGDKANAQVMRDRVASKSPPQPSKPKEAKSGKKS